MIEEGVVRVSIDGNYWKAVEEFKFGNLINDPVTRKHYFEKSVQARFVKIESTVMA